MARTGLQKFASHIHKNLCHYVYQLVDPRTGQTFYVGKGKNNRVFQHMEGAVSFVRGKNKKSMKMETIQAIINAGFEPIHIIHRHGLTEKEAKEVEASLIDAIGGLTNVQSGYESRKRGPANATQLIRRYDKKLAKIKSGHKIIAVNIKKSSKVKSIYDAVRFAWKVSRKRAEKADYVFAVKDGVCLNVFVPEIPWLDATRKNFPGLASEDRPGRLGFEGKEADKEILERYRNKRLPSSLQAKKGARNPIHYNYK